MTWQLIDTVPIDTVVDLFVTWPKCTAGFKGYRVTDCYYIKNEGKWTSKNFDSDSNRRVNNPSHWMHLPNAPKNLIQPDW